MTKLGLPFYNRHVAEVAQDLLGKTLVFNNIRAMIVETEAYRGYDDEASHASKGPTPRSMIMFGDPGYSYVYLIYGMYYCLNIIAEEKGQASGVLIRGLQLPSLKLYGPGKICKYLAITKEHNGIDLIKHNNFYLIDENVQINYKATSRIGINKAKDKLWRFVLDSSV